MPRPLLEVCLTTLADARAAHAAGADRLELCAALELDGLTPSLGTLIEIRREFPALPVMFMLRPHPGPFLYSAADLLTMQRDADLALAHGAAGLVFGPLRPDHTIDPAQTRAFVQLAARAQTVFHRAFDLTPDPAAALETLVDLGVTRVLTSGRAPTALAGAPAIRDLVHRAAGRVEILPAGGVTAENAAAVLAQTAATQLHGSFADRTTAPLRTSGPRVAAARLAIDAGRA